jgi:hypothetical protein
MLHQPETLLTTKLAAEFLCLAPKSLANRRTKRQGPSYVLIGNRPRYRMSDILKWLDENCVRPAAPAKSNVDNR